jgi:hypothetical protein
MIDSQISNRVSTISHNNPSYLEYKKQKRNSLKSAQTQEQIDWQRFCELRHKHETALQELKSKDAESKQLETLTSEFDMPIDQYKKKKGKPARLTSTLRQGIKDIISNFNPSNKMVHTEESSPLLKIKHDNRVVFQYEPGSQHKLLKQKRNNMGKQFSFKFQHVAWEDNNKLPTPSYK